MTTTIEAGFGAKLTGELWRRSGWRIFSPTTNSPRLQVHFPKTHKGLPVANRAGTWQTAALFHVANTCV
jgi:hypothetical protein